MARRGPGALPGFGLALGWTLTWLSLIVLVPLATLVWKSTDLGWAQFWALATSKRALASYQLTFGTALAAATVNLVLGTVVAWVLVRYRFWGQSVVDALVDVPFALPTAVSGLAITAALAPRGWIGSVLADHGVRVVYTRYGIAIALIFTGLPFVVRSVQPVLIEVDRDVEQAAASLGASNWTIFRRVVLPTLAPAIISGGGLAFARAIGEYGSVVLIGGNIPRETQVASQYIQQQIEIDRPVNAAAVSVALLAISFATLLILRFFASRGQEREEKAT